MVDRFEDVASKIIGGTDQSGFLEIQIMLSVIYRDDRTTNHLGIWRRI